ncbi:hypothetical protein [Chitinophaga sp. CF118]|nr:hypothetical protein [Chitinophaga sp. CF118]
MIAIPDVIISPVLNTSSDSVSFEGYVASNGGGTILSHGFAGVRTSCQQ